MCPPDPVPRIAVADAAPIALLVLELKTEVESDGMLMREALQQQSSPVWLQHPISGPLGWKGEYEVALVCFRSGGGKVNYPAYQHGPNGEK